MDEYRPVPFQEILGQMPEDERFRLEERWQVLRAEEEFWNRLPEDERNKRIEKPKVSYDPETDILWLKNGRPTPRSYDIAKGRVTVFFEADIWYPSAVMVSGAYQLLGQLFCPDDTLLSDTLVIRHGENGLIEKFLNLDNLEINYENMSDCLWINNGESGFGHREFAEDLSVCFTEDYQIPIGVLLTPAAELLTPILANAEASKSDRLVRDLQNSSLSP